ncbi:RluA family pseudouridine synthase [Parabacteroides chinchillae]|uniref:tRNA pseudouridine32 synthase / 23S rRNA pseudouridine746 synthase n=1 Tax=Parabacteroides chinchillae TaxID=871327 RepID=A0A8G2BY98_9BACT|nr:RluA family pseudouridine synthase [Parabacteroides chinchillae]SEG16254.1 tRNA pseudouridine32 synthase / 23S rRNA pseudouridine746 synthase [Parabacteroides chinchillae]
MFHLLHIQDSSPALPQRFTYPFHYIPHPLCVQAAQEVQAYLEKQEEWREELEQGKMFGVLITKNHMGKLGFLAAFSGTLAGKNLHPYFVPPIYDLLEPEGFFKPEEDRISSINKQIEAIAGSKEYQACKQHLRQQTKEAELSLKVAKAQLTNAKKKRDACRMNHPDAVEQAAMIRESQYEKAEFKRLKNHWKERISSLQANVETFEQEINRLKAERKERSAALQQKLFEQFRMLNARGESKNLLAIFEQAKHQLPPAGAGECAAPRLLQYAYLKKLHPIAMAEFWWGQSPKAEIRRHGYYYPACKGKCEPILNHMLQGLEVDPNPLAEELPKETELRILWEDEWLAVVDKPAGMPSVPGKLHLNSVYSEMQKRYPEATGPLVAHRLDMATSGLLIVAKTMEVYQNLQIQFSNRTIRKRYIALLEGKVSLFQGIIDLPLCLDPEDRPRQMVSDKYGKRSVTEYQVLGYKDGITRIAFYPYTGRTHQLRVHAAHTSGLNAPIIGDELYGKKAERLYLDAVAITFRHPVTGETICVEKEETF